MSDDAKHDGWLDAVEADGINLTPWEEEFVASLREQRERDRSLSERQAEILERIYAQRTP